MRKFAFNLGSPKHEMIHNWLSRLILRSIFEAGFLVFSLFCLMSLMQGGIIFVSFRPLKTVIAAIARTVKVCIESYIYVLNCVSIESFEKYWIFEIIMKL